MSECAVCSESLAPTISWPKCNQCSGIFHYKCTNGGIHQQTWRSLSAELKEEWVCKPCDSINLLNREHGLDSSSESVEHNLSKKPCFEGNSDSDILSQISKQLGLLQTLPNDVRAINENVKEIKQDNATFKLELKNAMKKITLLETENSFLRQRLDELEESHEANIQYQLRNNVIISNVPEKSEENSEEVVRKLFDFLKIQVKEYDIVRCHRLPKNRTKRDGSADVDDSPPNLIVKFHHYDTKSKIMMAAIKESPKTTIFGDNNDSRIHVNHPFTKEDTRAVHVGKISSQKTEQLALGQLPRRRKNSSEKNR